MFHYLNNVDMIIENHIQYHYNLKKVINEPDIVSILDQISLFKDA